MATVTKPIALDESFNTTEVTPRNIADVLAEGLSHITGRTASEVEYDNTDSGLIADNVQDALDEIVEDIPTVPSVDIQRAVDEFSTYNGGILDSLKVTLEPIQDLHGYAEPWIGGAGKNKYDDTAKTSGAYLTTDGTTSGSGASDVSDYIPIKNGDVVMLSYHYNTLASANARYNCLYDENKQFVDYMTYTPTGDDGFKEYKITISNANAKYIRYTLDKQINHVQVEFGSTATDYESYENICPITGHTEVDVQNHQKNLIDWKVNTTSSPWNGIFESGNYVISAESTLADGNWYFRFTDANGEYSYTKEECGLGSFTKAASGWVYGGSTYQAIPFTVPNGCTLIEIGKMNTDGTIPAQVEEGSTATAYVPYNGYQVTVNLGGTYYSGILDIVSGVFVPDTAKQTYPWGTYTRTDDLGNTRRRILATLSDALGTVSSDIGANISDSVEEQTGWTTDTPHFYIDSSNKTLVVFLPISTPDSTNIEVCYKLATPQSIQLSPTMVKALVGENHLSAPLDKQEITESKYKQLFTFDDVIAYIQSIS